MGDDAPPEPQLRARVGALLRRISDETSCEFASHLRHSSLGCGGWIVRFSLAGLRAIREGTERGGP